MDLAEAMNLPIQSKISIITLSLLFLIAGCLVAPSDSGSAFAKSKTSSKKKKRSKKTSKKKRLVPPPPPYAPSILPELAYARRHKVKTVEEESEKPVNPYAKYIYHRDSQKIPTPVRPNKYVSYWGNR